MDLENLNLLFNKGKEIIETLPTNTKENQDKKQKFLSLETDKVTKLKNDIQNELKERYLKLENATQNEAISSLKKEEEKLSLFKEWNNYNTSYEKMHLDYYLYQLHRYYKEDFNSVNTCIYSVLESFKKVGIDLKEEDFYYHEFAKTYMNAIINNKENVHEIFESIYWKCSEILNILEMNFKSIYYKNLKKIEKYYIDRKEQFLKDHNETEVYDAYYNTILKRNALESIDVYTILQKFLNKEVLISDIGNENIIKKKNKFFNGEVNNSVGILDKLYGSLEEYNLYNKYKYIIDDMRLRIKDKDKFQDKLDQKLKEIDKKEKELFKFNEKQSKKMRISTKAKKDENFVTQHQQLYSDLMSLYSELDDIRYNELILEKLSFNVFISDVLKMASSNYLYFVKLKKDQNDKLGIKEISDEFQEFSRMVNDIPLTFLNNIYVLVDKNIPEIISDRYKLLNVTIESDNLEENNLKNVMKDIKDILLANSISKTALSLDDIDFYLEINKSGIFENPAT